MPCPSLCSVYTSAFFWKLIIWTRKKVFGENPIKSDVPWQKCDLLDGFLSPLHYMSPFRTRVVLWGDTLAKSTRVFFLKRLLVWQHMSQMHSGLSSFLHYSAWNKSSPDICLWCLLVCPLPSSLRFLPDLSSSSEDSIWRKSFLKSEDVKSLGNF